jgi:site-specific DNA-adenine methylase
MAAVLLLLLQKTYFQGSVLFNKKNRFFVSIGFP